MKFRIRNKKDLKLAYKRLKLYEEVSKKYNNKGVEIEINKLKVDIRNYHKKPIDERIVQVDGIDGYVKLVYMPRYFDDLGKDKVKKYFEEHYVLGRSNSMYDCTGQAFTSWFTVVRRGGRWVVYHSISFDY